MQCVFTQISDPTLTPRYAELQIQIQIQYQNQTSPLDLSKAHSLYRPYACNSISTPNQANTVTKV
jgi:hypothetical protein